MSRTIADQHLDLWQATFENHERQLRTCIVSAEPEFNQKKIAASAVVKAIQEYNAVCFRYLKEDAEQFGYHVRAVLDDSRTPNNNWYWTQPESILRHDGYPTEEAAWKAAVKHLLAKE